MGSGRCLPVDVVVRAALPGHTPLHGSPVAGWAEDASCAGWACVELVGRVREELGTAEPVLFTLCFDSADVSWPERLTAQWTPEPASFFGAAVTAVPQAASSPTDKSTSGSLFTSV